MTTTPVDAAWPGSDRADGGYDLTDTVAVISGGGRGVGKLMAVELARAGALVGLLARSGTELATVAAEIEHSGGTAATAACDVSDPKAATIAVSELARQLGPANLLINNAGVSGPAGQLWDVSPAEWWQAIEVNVGGTFTLTRLLLHNMVAAGRGRVVNITSNAGVYRWPLMSAYVASKAALIKLTETLAAETRPHGVSVFSVDPGLVAIGLTETALTSHAEPQTPQGQVFGWIREQLNSGHGTDPAKTVRLVLALAAGGCDRLSGRHLSASDDLEVLLSHIDRIERYDLHTLRLGRLQ